MALKFAALLDDHSFQFTLLKMRNAANNTASAMRRDFDRLTDALPGGGFLARLGPGGVGVGAAATALGGIAAAGDKAANSLARINAATGDLDQAEAVFGSLRQLAGQTGVAIEDAAGQFTRFSIAARQIGASNDEIIKLIGLMQKAGTVGGSSATEISAAGMQLGQALASGRFQGDELRSIMENMPLLAEQLAKNLGVSVGELREMGKEGQLTTDVVFPALLKSADAIEEKFSEMPMTMSRAWGTAKTEILGFLADIDKATGFSRTVAGTVEGLMGYGPGDRAEIAAANRLKADADAEIKAKMDELQELSDRRAARMIPEVAPIQDRKHEQDAKDTADVLKKQAAEAKKAADDEVANAERIKEAYAQSYVDRLARQEELRQRSNEAADESVRNAAREKEVRGLEDQLDAAGKIKDFWQQRQQEGEADMAQFNRASPDERRQMNRDALDERRAKAREERMEGKQDARAGAGRRLEDIEKAKVQAVFADEQITKITDAIAALMPQ